MLCDDHGEKILPHFIKVLRISAEIEIWTKHGEIGVASEHRDEPNQILTDVFSTMLVDRLGVSKHESRGRISFGRIAIGSSYGVIGDVFPEGKIICSISICALFGSSRERYPGADRKRAKKVN
ncbi:hypothetical protein DC366_10005 [Pelagivirga sediminicola]|uniref:Uncharacterized protein n=1 Tax=Pelagivirga sediminicola TaxID=2170575 RepID=A0A2T7G6C9_9RHOB|nr:hypothetical protein DC366_10005 [Pelagivirga sediminicola]